MAWLGWNHPAMPWDSTDLMSASITADGTLTEPVRLAGGGQESITQVEWAADGSGRFYAVTDPQGWWNVHEILPDGGSRELCGRAEEFGDAMWRIGLRWLLPLDDGGLAVLHGVGERRLRRPHPGRAAHGLLGRCHRMVLPRDGRPTDRRGVRGTGPAPYRRPDRSGKRRGRGAARPGGRGHGGLGEHAAPAYVPGPGRRGGARPRLSAA